MGLGGTAKKLQKVASMAEDLYAQLNDLRGQLVTLRETTEQTHTTVERLQHEQAVNRALLERLAEQQNIDVDEVVSTIAVDEPETTQSPTDTETETEAGTETRTDAEWGHDQGSASSGTDTSERTDRSPGK